MKLFVLFISISALWICNSLAEQKTYDGYQLFRLYPKKKSQIKLINELELNDNNVIYNL